MTVANRFNRPTRVEKIVGVSSALNENEKRVRKKNLKIHELTGLITHKELYKVYHKNSPYQGNQCYKLQIVLGDKEGAREKLFVYPNVVPPPIYQAIQENHYIDKRYLLFCSKKTKGWVLHNWQELPSKVSGKKLANHVQEK